MQYLLPPHFFKMPKVNFRISSNMAKPPFIFIKPASIVTTIWKKNLDRFHFFYTSALLLILKISEKYFLNSVNLFQVYIHFKRLKNNATMLSYILYLGILAAQQVKQAWECIYHLPYSFSIGKYASSAKQSVNNVKNTDLHRKYFDSLMHLTNGILGYKNT